MTYIYRNSAQQIAVAGTTIAHGLGFTPDEVTVLPTVAQGAGETYKFSASDATSIYLAQGTSATTADISAHYWHSVTR